MTKSNLECTLIILYFVVGFIHACFHYKKYKKVYYQNFVAVNFFLAVLLWPFGVIYDILRGNY